MSNNQQQKENNMNALNTLLATSGFIVAMLGFGVAIIRGTEWASNKEKV